jgi:monothiol glutaredoxin
MNRPVLDSNQVHPDALNFITRFHHETVQEVVTAVKSHKIVVVGMSQNPVVKKARRHLENLNMDYHYLSYGSYFSGWKKRLAIKLWSGWPTFPQVFIDGKLIGGCDDLIKFLKK